MVARGHDKRALASICLVDKTCLALARPILYRDVAIKLGTRGGHSWPKDDHLVKLLMTSSAHADMIRSLDLFLGDFVESDFVQFRLLLEATCHLVSIRLSEGRYCYRGYFCATIVAIIVASRPGIESIDFISFPLLLPELEYALGRLCHLETLKFSLVDWTQWIEPRNVLALAELRLSQLEIFSPLSNVAFRDCFHSSFDRLVHVRIELEPALEPINLSRLSHLDHLHLYSSYANRNEIVHGHLESVLRSTIHLPISRLVLEIPIEIGSGTRRELDSILLLFPTTMRNLVVLKQGWAALTWSALFGCDDRASRPYPHLTDLILLSPSPGSELLHYRV